MAGIWNLPSPPDTIPNPVEMPKLPPPGPERKGTEFRILAVGRLERRKDQATLIHALDRFFEWETSWKATIVGPDTQTGPGGGSYKSYLLQIASERVRKQIIWIDGLPRERLWALYMQSDVAVVCTTEGGWGYATTDPMTTGCPVITTDSDGTESSYVRHGQTAWLYRSGDDGALAVALRAVLHDPDMRARLGTAARTFISQELSPAGVAARVLTRVGLDEHQSADPGPTEVVK
jgi:glycosyltransferase involved in cell wall biosynthesis